MNKASDKALEVYPPHLVGDPTFPYGQWDVHGLERRCYQEGYEQAEQDLALIAEDVSCIIHLADQFGKDYQRIADVFNKDREEEGR